MQTKRAAVSQMVKVLIQRVGGILLFLLASGWVIQVQVAIYFAFYLLSAVLALLLVFLINPQALAVREPRAKPPAPLWDKIILSIYYLLAFYLIYLVAGLETSPETMVSSFMFLLAMALNLLSFGLSVWAMLVNPFLESQARVQHEQEQQVITTGPYAIVRHPTYLALVIWAVSIILIFDTPLTRYTASVILLLIIVRTYLEDQMLFKGLSGYQEYCQKTKWRLLPFIF